MSLTAAYFPAGSTRRMATRVIFILVALFESLPAEPERFKVDPKIANILSSYCTDCHEEGTEKGKLRLDQLEALPLDSLLEVMNRMHERVHFGEMPPKKEDQPTEDERKQLENWLAEVLHANHASKLEEKLRMPEYGNKVDHEKLFSGSYRNLPGHTPDRRWLISEFIFNAKFNRILDFKMQTTIDGKSQSVVGSTNRSVNLTNPFLLPTHSGVRYYDTATLESGHLLTMHTNAKQASAYLIKKRNGLPVTAAILAAQFEHERILATRESHLRTNIEELLRDLFKEKHEGMRPAFVPTQRSPIEPPDKNFDVRRPANEEIDKIITTVRKHAKDGLDREKLILLCEEEWFYHGVSERVIMIRVTWLRGYLEEAMRRWKVSPVKSPSPTPSDLDAIRTGLLKHRQHGDTYAAIISKCMAEWSDELRRERERTVIPDETFAKLIDELFIRIMEREPTPKEKSDYIALTKDYLLKLGNELTVDRLIQTLILRSEFVYRQEFGEGEADEHGRKMLSPRDASYALAYALTDSSPDKELQEAARNGKLVTREDYRREVERMLKVQSQYYLIDEAVGADSLTNIPIRKLRFFREFFGYPAMLPIFKDNKRFGGDYGRTFTRFVTEADMLVEFILKQDRNVFERLLTTEEFYVFHSGDNTAMAASSGLIQEIHGYFKDEDWRNFNDDDLKAHIPFLKEHPMPGLNLDAIGKVGGRSNQLKIFKDMMTNYSERLGSGLAVTAPFSTVFGVANAAQTRTGAKLGGAEVAKSFNLDLKSWNYPTSQPARMEHRRGILTHPAWLIAFAANTQTDPVRRGKWIREKLLAGSIPDVPVTVDAVIPEDHHQTLRQRLEKKTEAEYCWQCHVYMNPLGTTFEMYDDFGRYRIEEFLEHPDNLVRKMPDKGSPQDDLRDLYKTLPVNTTGHLEGTGDPELDGDVRDAIDLVERLGKSSKVRQSIIRHAFRYFMGRNEVLSDSKTLIDADQAYLQSGGSFDAVIVSLLTSDSFIYRKPAN